MFFYLSNLLCFGFTEKLAKLLQYVNCDTLYIPQISCQYLIASYRKCSMYALLRNYAYSHGCRLDKRLGELEWWGKNFLPGIENGSC